ncbi:MAG: CSLREA domain-containing protein, partial [Bacteroidales bacterium]
KGLLCVMVLSAMSLMAAEDKTLYVNTFDDEDGENLNKCSLREAIKTACMMISDHGVLLVAGKGHENYQEINHVKHHFDDAEEIAAFLQ